MAIIYKLVRLIILLPFAVVGVPGLLALSDNTSEFKKNVKDFLWP